MLVIEAGWFIEVFGYARYLVKQSSLLYEVARLVACCGHILLDSRASLCGEKGFDKAIASAMLVLLCNLLILASKN